MMKRRFWAGACAVLIVLLILTQWQRHEFERQLDDLRIYNVEIRAIDAATKAYLPVRVAHAQQRSDHSTARGIRFRSRGIDGGGAAIEVMWAGGGPALFRIGAEGYDDETRLLGQDDGPITVPLRRAKDGR